MVARSSVAAAEINPFPLSGSGGVSLRQVVDNHLNNNTMGLQLIGCRGRTGQEDEQLTRPTTGLTSGSQERFLQGTRRALWDTENFGGDSTLSLRLCSLRQHTRSCRGRGPSTQCSKLSCPRSPRSRATLGRRFGAALDFNEHLGTLGRADQWRGVYCNDASRYPSSLSCSCASLEVKHIGGRWARMTSVRHIKGRRTFKSERAADGASTESTTRKTNGKNPHQTDRVSWPEDGRPGVRTSGFFAARYKLSAVTSGCSVDVPLAGRVQPRQRMTHDTTEPGSTICRAAPSLSGATGGSRR